MKGLLIIACMLAFAATMMTEGFSQGPALGLGQIAPLQTMPRSVEAAQASVQSEVRANRFVLVDDNGRKRASLVPDDDGSVFLILFDVTGKNRINLSLTPAGPSLASMIHPASASGSWQHNTYWLTRLRRKSAGFVSRAI